MDRLLIVDGHAYAYRAFHAIRSLRSPSGRPTNAIYGFVKMLAKMRSAIEPTHLIVVWDGGLSAQRVSVLPEYKAQRPAMPDDLKPQLDEIVGYLQAAGIGRFFRQFRRRKFARQIVPQPHQFAVAPHRVRRPAQRRRAIFPTSLRPAAHTTRATEPN